MNRTDMSYRGRRRLDDVADRAGRDAIDHVDAEAVDTARVLATDLAETDDLLRGAVDAAARLDSKANERRKEVNERGGDPFNDPVLTSLRSARESAREAVDTRVEEVIEEAVEYADREAAEVEA